MDLHPKQLHNYKWKFPTWMDRKTGAQYIILPPSIGGWMEKWNKSRNDMTTNNLINYDNGRIDVHAFIVKINELF